MAADVTRMEEVKHANESITALEQTGQALSFAREMSDAYNRRVRWYREGCEQSIEEAHRRCSEPAGEDYTKLLLEKPVTELSWEDFRTLEDAGVEIVSTRWEEITQAAWAELVSGHRAGHVVRGYNKPFDLARFLSLRNELSSEWNPQNGIERTLIDQMAQAYTMQLLWMGTLNNWFTRMEEDQPKDDGYWRPPRMDHGHAIEQAGQMVDRFNRLFLRTLRQLRDLRRYSPAVIVQNAGQVNVANQQVNLSQSDSEGEL